MNTEKFGEWFGAFMVVIGILCFLALIVGLPLWILWNLLMPKLFGLPAISFWQAVGLNLICSILFRDWKVSSNKK